MNTKHPKDAFELLESMRPAVEKSLQFLYAQLDIKAHRSAPSQSLRAVIAIASVQESIRLNWSMPVDMKLRLIKEADILTCFLSVHKTVVMLDNQDNYKWIYEDNV